MLPRNVWGRLSTRVPLGPWAGVAYDRLDAVVAKVPGIRALATAWALVADRPD